jgi:AraC-like DNA-binding protein
MREADAARAARQSCDCETGRMAGIASSTGVEATDASWRMRVFAPVAPLAGWVRAATWYRESWPGSISRRQVATSGAVLFLTWGAPLEVSFGGTSASFSAFAAGVSDRPARTEHAGRQEGVGVHLSALGACRLLGVSGAELANCCVDLSEMLGRDADELVDRLEGVASPARRVALVQAALAGRVGLGPKPAPEVIWACQALSMAPSVRVGDLAAEVGWSRTRLASRFSAQVGLSPKRFSRVVRFERACRLLACGSSSLAEVAVRAGYHDQAHLSRDVRALAGTTPATLAAELTSGGPADP